MVDGRWSMEAHPLHVCLDRSPDRPSMISERMRTRSCGGCFLALFDTRSMWSDYRWLGKAFLSLQAGDSSPLGHSRFNVEESVADEWPTKTDLVRISTIQHVLTCTGRSRASAIWNGNLARATAHHL